MPHITSLGSRGLALHNFCLYFFTSMPAKSFWIDLPLPTPCLPRTEGKAKCVTLWARGTYGVGELHLSRSKARLSCEGSALVTEAEQSLPWSSISGMLPLPSAVASWRFSFLLAFAGGYVSNLGFLPYWVCPHWSQQIGAHFFLISSEEGRVETCLFCGAQGLCFFMWVSNPWQFLVVL